MEKRIYLYKTKDGTKIKMFDAEMPSMDSNGLYEFCGTVTLNVNPPKKEVVKEIHIELQEPAYDGERMAEARYLEKGAYDAKIVYKVKE